MMSAYIVLSMNLYYDLTSLPKSFDSLVVKGYPYPVKAFSFLNDRFGSVVGETILANVVLRRSVELGKPLSESDIEAFLLDVSEEFRERPNDFGLGLES